MFDRWGVFHSDSRKVSTVMQARPVNNNKFTLPTCPDVIKSAGYHGCTKISATMQGNVWRSIQRKTKKNVAIKSSNIDLHTKSIIIDNNTEYKVQEDILKETAVLNYLSYDKQCPSSIAKYIDSFKRYAINL